MTSTEQPAKPSSLRLLILSPSPSDSTSIPPLTPFLEAITGNKPLAEITTFAGYTSHPPLRLRTKYYSADVSIWCDELPVTSSSGDNGKASLSAYSKKTDVPDGDKASTEAAEGDEYKSSPPTLEEWKSQILSPEASEVRAVLRGIILLLPISVSSLSQSSPTSQPSSSVSATLLPSYISLIETVHVLRETIENESYGWDVASLFVLQATTSSLSKGKLDEVVEKIEEVCLSEGILGWDFVAWDGQLPNHDTEPGKAVGDGNDDREQADERNEYGEKTGIERVIEVLQGVDWSASPNYNGDDDQNGESDLAELDYENLDGAMPSSTSRNILGTGRFSGLDFELQREMMELKMSMLEDDGNNDDDGGDKDQDDEETQIEQLPGLIERVVAIREAGSEMPKAEREKFARREIGRIMREMG